MLLFLVILTGVFQHLGIEIEHNLFGYIVAVVADAFETTYDAYQIEALGSPFGYCLQMLGNDRYRSVIELIYPIVHLENGSSYLPMVIISLIPVRSKSSASILISG